MRTPAPLKTDDGVSGAQIADVGPLPHLDHAMRPLSLFVHPTAGNDTNAGTTADLPLRTLMAAQKLLRLALAREPAQSVRVLLLPGHHRVPPGGLRLTSKNCPAGDHRVLWSGGGNISTVSGGDPVVGWRRALGPGLPASVFAAPAPHLPTGTARHLFVDGVRTRRTRMNSTMAVGVARHTGMPVYLVTNWKNAPSYA